MNKREKIFLSIIFLLIIGLVVMTVLFLNMKKNAENNLDNYLKLFEENGKLIQEINELKEITNN